MTKLHAAARAALQGPRDGGRRPRIVGFAALALATLLVVSACAGGGIAREKGWSAPVVSDGMLYLGNRDGQVLAFEAARLDNGFRTGALPVDLDEPDSVDHQSAFKGRFQATDDENENSLGFYASPLIVDDTLIIGGLDGKLYALSRADIAEQIGCPHSVRVPRAPTSSPTRAASSARPLKPATGSSWPTRRATSTR